MRIKTFQGRSLEEVLPQIKAELGPTAVVVGQRTKVQGGVAGFFGTKVIEVTAADQMPSDAQLVALEDQLMGGDQGGGGGGGQRDPEPAPERVVDEKEAALAERFAEAMGLRMGRQGGLDVTDDWDPSQDAELANEYGRVLEHAAAAGFAEMEVPMAQATVPTPAAPQPQPAGNPLAQAQALAQRTHEHVQQTAAHVDQAVYAPQMTPTQQPAQTYAPPRALPRTTPVEERARTFAASVLDTPMQGYEPQAVESPATAARAVDEALRSDLTLAPAPAPAVAPTPPALRSSGDDIADALDAAVDMIDLKAMAALRNAMHVSRRLQETSVNAAVDAEVELDLGRITEQLARVGVDDDVVEALVDSALRHRRPFGGEQAIDPLMREMVEESIDVRSGFPRLNRAYRMAIVGASSAGKTTVVAKLASAYRAAGLHVGILSIVSAEPGLAVMGDNRFNALDVDVRYAATPEQAQQGAEAFAGHDLMLVDTPGSAYLDPATFAQTQSCLAAIGVDDVHVVVPLATSSREARSLVDAFRPLGANRMIVSRLDESRYIGQLLNFGFRLGVPMTFLSEGPRVPGDLCAASARDIAHRIMPTISSH